MSVTGFYSKNFFRQSGNFGFNANFSNISNNFNFGVTGYTDINFKYFNGKIFDTFNNLVYHAPTEFDFNFRFDRNNSTISYFINDELISAIKTGINIFNTGSYFDYFYINNTGNPIDLSLDVFGSQPTVSLSSINSNDGITYSGNIFVNSQYATITNITGYDNNLNGSGSGLIVSSGYLYNYILSGDSFGSGDSVSILLSTNFGEQILYPFVNQPNENDTGYIQFYNNSIDNTIGTSEYLEFVSSYYWTNPKQLTIGLYHTRSVSEILVSGTGIGSGIYTGVINGSGYLYSPYLLGYLDGTSIYATGDGSGFFYSTGQLVYSPFVTVSGYEAGVLSTGVIQFNLTGIVLPENSGIYTFSVNPTGTPAIAYNVNGIVSNPTGIYTGVVSTGIILNTYMSTYSTGLMINATGLMSDYETNKNNFTLQTGNSDFSIYEDFKVNDWTDGSGFFHSNEINGFYDFVGRIYYTPINANATDYATLRISNGIDTIEYDIIAT
jgi:hypothetical protein